MLSTVQLFHRINYLIPNSKFVIWNIEHRDNDNGYEDPYKIYIIDQCKIVWYPENELPMPSEKELKEIEEQTIENHILEKIKEGRNTKYENDLAIKACYQLTKSNNLDLTFSEYLDNLEKMI